jgi:uncharacterized protein YprB with RNaseH-like and TPR domain
VVSGGDVPKLWKNYLRTGSQKNLTLIMQHNLSDLLREAIHRAAKALMGIKRY